MIQLIINIITLFGLLIISFLFNKKLETFRNENQKTIDLFRNELFKKGRKFELKYDLMKNFTYVLTQIHSLIYQFDFYKTIDVFEKLMYYGQMVSNFYGEAVKNEILNLGQKLNEILNIINIINAEINKIPIKEQILEERKKLIDILVKFDSPFKEIYEQIKKSFEIEEKDLSKEKIEDIFNLLKIISESTKSINQISEKIVISMADELKREYFSEIDFHKS